MAAYSQRAGALRYSRITLDICPSHQRVFALLLTPQEREAYYFDHATEGKCDDCYVHRLANQMSREPRRDYRPSTVKTQFFAKTPVYAGEAVALDDDGRYVHHAAAGEPVVGIADADATIYGGARIWSVIVTTAGVTTARIGACQQ